MTLGPVYLAISLDSPRARCMGTPATAPALQSIGPAAQLPPPLGPSNPSPAPASRLTAHVKLRAGASPPAPRPARTYYMYTYTSFPVAKRNFYAIFRYIIENLEPVKRYIGNTTFRRRSIIDKRNILIMILLYIVVRAHVVDATYVNRCVGAMKPYADR